MSDDAGEPFASETRFTRWPWWRRWFGQRSERAAARILRRMGYRILAANISVKGGELDLVALEKDTLVVVEVRSTAAAGLEALERTAASVDYRKQCKITRATLRYLNSRRLLGRIPVRFDVLVLSWPPNAREPVVHHIRQAFEAQGRFQFFS